MTHHGHEPPWDDPYSRYGWWERGEELWDGSGYEWHLRPAKFRSPFIDLMELIQPIVHEKVSWLEDVLLPEMPVAPPTPVRIERS